MYFLFDFVSQMQFLFVCIYIILHSMFSRCIALIRFIGSRSRSSSSCSGNNINNNNRAFDFKMRVYHQSYFAGFSFSPSSSSSLLKCHLFQLKSNKYWLLSLRDEIIVDLFKMWLHLTISNWNILESKHTHTHIKKTKQFGSVQFNEHRRTIIILFVVFTSIVFN